MTVSKFEVEFTGGSIEDGYFEKYRTAKGYLVSRRPNSVFVNILNPLTSSSVLVMASHEELFQIWIPSRNQFVTGRADVERDEENPVYIMAERGIGHYFPDFTYAPAGYSFQPKKSEIELIEGFDRSSTWSYYS